MIRPTPKELAEQVICASVEKNRKGKPTGLWEVTAFDVLDGTLSINELRELRKNVERFIEEHAREAVQS